jgi:predicted cobalt transporter CbtA
LGRPVNTDLCDFILIPRAIEEIITDQRQSWWLIVMYSTAGILSLVRFEETTNTQSLIVILF